MKTRKSPPEVELNLAAMLDMAFQILVFFVLTFRPAPVEGQVELRMPPPQARGGEGDAAAGAGTDPLKNLTTLPIVLIATSDGYLGQIRVAERPAVIDPQLAMFHAQLKKLFGDPATPFDQVVIQVGSTMRYDELMRVLDVCSRQRLPGGQRLSKLSIVPDNE